MSGNGGDDDDNGSISKQPPSSDENAAVSLEALFRSLPQSLQDLVEKDFVIRLHYGFCEPWIDNALAAGIRPRRELQEEVRQECDSFRTSDLGRELHENYSRNIRSVIASLTPEEQRSLGDEKSVIDLVMDEAWKKALDKAFKEAGVSSAPSTEIHAPSAVPTIEIRDGYGLRRHDAKYPAEWLQGKNDNGHGR